MKLLWNQEDFLHFDDVRVRELPQGFDLSELEAFFPIFVLAFHLFDGDYFVGFVVDGLVNCAESAISQNAYYFIFLHNKSL